MTSESEDLECGMHHRAYGIAKWVHTQVEIAWWALNLLLEVFVMANRRLKAQVEKGEGPSGEGQSPRVEKDECPSGEGCRPRGKQGWRFISHPDVMVTKVFKVEYFSNVNLLDANLGHNPSFVWHRVFASQVVIREGFRWRLGRGNSITIWKQPWLKT
ncbi:hypothetical protein D0Y65_046380 [Glycine soja]|uniref:Uncharacterized protein n=1 Tax=Glycine soja TaxID=3848 RepID=A0A445G917_GLYSO|nr:hypothetical protein D0Y65_046380 [Glycine soja]